MNESEIFAGFSVRELQDNRRVAVLHLLAPDGMPSTEESVFDASSLAMRVESLRSHGFDCSMSEAALLALRARSPAGAEPEQPELPRLDIGGGAPAQRGAAPGTRRTGAPTEDFLTGLPGRAALLRALKDAIADSQGRIEHPPHVAVLTVRDLDIIAEEAGPNAVRRALLEVADRLDENLRRLDVLAHLGGARFAACLPRVPRSDAEMIARRLVRAVAAPPIVVPGGPGVLEVDAEVVSLEPQLPGQPAVQAAALLEKAEGRQRKLAALTLVAQS